MLFVPFRLPERRWAVGVARHVCIRRVALVVAGSIRSRPRAGSDALPSFRSAGRQPQRQRPSTRHSHYPQHPQLHFDLLRNVLRRPSGSALSLPEKARGALSPGVEPAERLPDFGPPCPGWRARGAWRARAGRLSVPVGPAWLLGRAASYVPCGFTGRHPTGRRSLLAPSAGRGRACRASGVGPQPYSGLEPIRSTAP